MFAPTLFIGAMLGASVGSFEKLFFPHLTGSVGSYALVGMGVLFAAFLRAPFTSVFMVMEVSGNYSIVVPVIIANTVAYLISRSLQPVPIFEVLTHEDGLYLPSMEEQREERDLHLEDALQPIVVPILQGSEVISEAMRSLTKYGEIQDLSPILVHCHNGLWYTATKQELDTLSAEMSMDQVAFNTARLDEKLGAERTPILFPDLPLSSALPHFQRWPLLPVINRALRGALEGAVSLKDVLERYQQR